MDVESRIELILNKIDSIDKNVDAVKSEFKEHRKESQEAYNKLEKQLDNHIHDFRAHANWEDHWREEHEAQKVDYVKRVEKLEAIVDENKQWRTKKDTEINLIKSLGSSLIALLGGLVAWMKIHGG